MGPNRATKGEPAGRLTASIFARLQVVQELLVELAEVPALVQSRRVRASRGKISRRREARNSR
jgi:hypothetical protein